VRAQIETHLALLEGLASSPEDPLEEKIAYLTPPRRAAGSGEGA
jgi:hypothetical protein